MKNYRIYSGELYHHGIKGMKWGVRRYQNPDGTLTEEGLQRYRRQSDSKIRFIKDKAVRKLDENNHIINTKKMDKIASMPTRTESERNAKIKAQEELLKDTLKRTDAGSAKWIKGDDRVSNDPIEEKYMKDTIDYLMKEYGEKEMKKMESYETDDINRGYDLANRFWWARYNPYEAFSDNEGLNIKSVDEKWSSIPREERYTVKNNEKRHEEEYSALLKDFGFEDTERSRRYLERLIA